jgi:hypothetical protein
LIFFSVCDFYLEMAGKWRFAFCHIRYCKCCFHFISPGFWSFASAGQILIRHPEAMVASSASIAGQISKLLWVMCNDTISLHMSAAYIPGNSVFSLQGGRISRSPGLRMPGIFQSSYSSQTDRGPLSAPVSGRHSVPGQWNLPLHQV